MNISEKIFLLAFYLIIGILRSDGQVQINGVLHASDNGTLFVKSGIIHFGGVSSTTTSKATPYNAINGKIIIGANSDFSTDGTAPKFVDGYAGTIKNNGTLLAIGSTTVYAPVQVTAPSITNGVHASYFNSSPLTAFNGGLDPSVLAVADTEYWIIKGDNSIISLSWRSLSGLSTYSYPCVTIVGYKTATSKWERINSSIDFTSVFGGLSTLSGSGSISSDATVLLSDYSSFTIGLMNVVTPTFTPVAPICSGATFSPLPTTSTNGISGTWSPAVNNTNTTTYTFTPTAGSCATNQSMTIAVNPIVTPTFAPVAAICSGENLSPLPTISTNGVSGTWSPALNNTNTTTYTFTPSAGTCATNQSMTITVNPIVTPTFTPVAAICSGETLSPLPTTSTNGINGTWSPALNNTSTTTYTFTPSSGNCVVNQSMTITVNPIVTPTFTPVAPICSGATMSPLPTTSTNGISGTWSPAVNNTNTTTYTFTPTAGSCATNQSITIAVNPIVTPTFAPVAAICSGENLSPLPTTSTNGVSGTWSPAINNTNTTTYTFTPSAGTCIINQTLTIVVHPLPVEPELINGGICVAQETQVVTSTYDLYAGNYPGNHQFKWYETTNTVNPVAVTSNPVYTVTSGGTYFVSVENLLTGCSVISNEATVLAINPATNISVNNEIIFAFSESNNTVVVTVSGGNGTYQYQLDDSLFQDTNVFSTIPVGLHTITVTDTIGCTYLTTIINVIDYPHFFTPNGDGYNDNWNIKGLPNQLDSKIFIFDRYGKLITEIKPYSIGWDGTLNGYELPSTDYWFTFYYREANQQKVFRSHFSLKR